MNNSLNILIVCEHASSQYGGEAILPLNYFRYLSKTNHTPYLITHERVRESLEQDKSIDQAAVFYLPDTKLHQLLHKCSKFLPDRISVVTVGFLMHLITQFYQWKTARSVIKSKGVDIVHETAPVSATQPSAMFALGVPVIIGPMNGGMRFPKAFSHMSGIVEKVLYKVIPIFSMFYNIILPGKLFAKLMLVANNRTFKALPKLRCGNVELLVENGVFSTKEAPQKSTKLAALNVLYVGRLVDWKTIDIAIDAIAKTKTQAHLTIVGGGVDKEKLEAYVATNNIQHIDFVGRVPHAEINQYYDTADIFVLPSIRECGGAVVLEAMSRGLPTIATDWGGPADYITQETGYLVAPSSREFMVSEFSRIIDMLSLNPELRYDIGMAAIQRVKEKFMWDTKVRKVVEYYQLVIAGKNKLSQMKEKG